jgi:CDP-glycerol glycerophosphotransferase (TagB/SpsB family)
MIEAFLLDTPVVLLSPAATIGGARPNGDARAFREYAHVRAALAHGPARIAESEERLLDHIRAYLADPSLDRVARARAAAEEAGPADGRAGERIARELLELAR